MDHEFCVRQRAVQTFIFCNFKGFPGRAVWRMAGVVRSYYRQTTSFGGL